MLPISDYGKPILFTFTSDEVKGLLRDHAARLRTEAGKLEGNIQEYAKQLSEDPAGTMQAFQSGVFGVFDETTLGRPVRRPSPVEIVRMQIGKLKESAELLDFLARHIAKDRTFEVSASVAASLASKQLDTEFGRGFTARLTPLGID